MTHLRESIWGLASALALVCATSLTQTPPAAAQLAPSSAATIIPSDTRSPDTIQLLRLSQALRATHSAKVMAIGSSSTVGVGASSPSRTYVARVETDLKSALKGANFQVIGRGISGELAQGAADRMKREVELAKPDLVIWQVGTNDALRHVAIDSFRNWLKKTLAWLQERHIDVILINPQYADALIKDAYYENVVEAIAHIARESQVLLVDRFDAMRKLQRERGGRLHLSADNLHMNDEGYRHLAEQLAATIIRALPQGSGNVAENRTATLPSAVK